MIGGVAYFPDGQIRNSLFRHRRIGRWSCQRSSIRLAGGTLWVSTEGGLSRLKDGRLITLNSKNGLPCDAVHWPIEDDDHALWLYMPCGLVRIAPSELACWGSVNPKHIRLDKTTHFYDDPME